MNRKLSRLGVLLPVVAIAASCGGGSDSSGSSPMEPGAGQLTVTTTTTGDPADPDGYLLQVAGLGVALPVNGQLTLQDLPEGSTTATLEGLASNCEPEGANPREVTIPAGGTAQLDFAVRCATVISDRILAARDVAGNSASSIIVSMTTTGADETAIGDLDETEAFLHPVVSPDGQRIYTTTTFGGSGIGIAVMNADGSNLHRILEDVALDRASLSPDGTRIAFFGHLGLSVANVDGSGIVGLGQYGSLPAWSPDGTKIAFVSEGGGPTEIIVVNSDGTNPVNLTDTPELREEDPAWSPDGDHIAFVREDESFRRDIYVMDANGSNVRNVTNTGFWVTLPTWSANGERIIFSQADQALNLVSVSAAGGNRVHLTTSDSIGYHGASHAPPFTP